MNIWEKAKQKHGRDGAARKDKVSKKNWVVNLGCPVDPDILQQACNILTLQTTMWVQPKYGAKLVVPVYGATTIFKVMYLIPHYPQSAD